MTLDDPFARLGLQRDCTLADASAARRRLARALHPDHGGDTAAMREVNQAFDLVVGHLTGRRQLDPVRPPTAPSGPRWSGGRRSATGPQLQHDVASFTIEALPPEAFEALLVVTSWFGEVLVDDPPYVLDVHLLEPAPCWCRLELVPDAGSSTVSLTVAAVENGAAPDVDVVRDQYVAALNEPGVFGEPLT
jgi:hypothetical protein